MSVMILTVAGAGLVFGAQMHEPCANSDAARSIAETQWAQHAAGKLLTLLRAA